MSNENREKINMIKRDLTNLNWTEESHFDQYDILRHYIKEKGVFPNNTLLLGITSKNGYICFDALYEKLKRKGKLIHKSNYYDSGIRKCYFELNDTFYLLDAIYDKPKKDFKELKHIKSFLNSKKDNLKIVGNLTILHKEEKLSKKDKEIINSCIIKTKIIPTIGLISRDENGFYLNDIPFETPNLSTELEIHYGENFTKFHEKLSEKLIERKKGLTIFYGEPGGGKSSYIKNLIYELSEKSSKEIIFLPSNLTNYLLEPEFNNFLLSIVETNKDMVENEDDSNIKKSNGIILIIEEAQNILRKREVYDNSQSIDNILNLTDGIMNDVYGIQVIATHNTKNSELDPALLRSGRLLAKREFKKLSVKESKKLANYLKIKKEINKEMTVAEIYSLLEESDNNILIDGDEIKNNNVGFNWNN